jgi:hypothetical protein
LNDTRSYVVAGIRQSAFDIMNDRFAKDNANMTGLPSVEQMTRVITRNFDPADDHHAETMMSLFGTLAKCSPR